MGICEATIHSPNILEKSCEFHFCLFCVFSVDCQTFIADFLLTNERKSEKIFCMLAV